MNYTERGIINWLDSRLKDLKFFRLAFEKHLPTQQ